MKNLFRWARKQDNCKIIADVRTLFDPECCDLNFDFMTKFVPSVRRYCEDTYSVSPDRVVIGIIGDYEDLSGCNSHSGDSYDMLRIIDDGKSIIAVVILASEVVRKDREHG